MVRAGVLGHVTELIQGADFLRRRVQLLMVKRKGQISQSATTRDPLGRHPSGTPAKLSPS